MLQIQHSSDIRMKPKSCIISGVMTNQPVPSSFYPSLLLLGHHCEGHQRPYQYHSRIATIYHFVEEEPERPKQSNMMFEIIVEDLEFEPESDSSTRGVFFFNPFCHRLSWFYFLLLTVSRRSHPCIYASRVTES